jgi:hypothetical protein
MNIRRWRSLNYDRSPQRAMVASANTQANSPASVPASRSSGPQAKAIEFAPQSVGFALLRADMYASAFAAVSLEFSNDTFGIWP